MSVLPPGTGTDFTGEWHLQPDMCFGDDFTELMKSQGVNAIFRALIMRGLPHVVHRVSHTVVQGRPSLHTDLTSPFRNSSEDIYTDGLPFTIKPPIIGQMQCTASYTADGTILCTMSQEAGTAVTRRFLGYRIPERPLELVDADTPGAKLCTTIEINWTSNTGKKLQCSRVLLPKNLPLPHKHQLTNPSATTTSSSPKAPAGEASADRVRQATVSPSIDYCDRCNWTPDAPESLCSSDCEYDGASPQQCRCDLGVDARNGDARSFSSAHGQPRNGDARSFSSAHGQPNAKSSAAASAALSSGLWITDASEAAHVAEVSSEDGRVLPPPSPPPTASAAIRSASKSQSFYKPKRTTSHNSRRFSQSFHVAELSNKCKHPAPIFRVTDRAFMPLARVWRGRTSPFGAETETEAEGPDSSPVATRNGSPSPSKTKPKHSSLHSPDPRDPANTASAYDADFGSIVSEAPAPSDTPTRMSRRTRMRNKVHRLFRRRQSSQDLSGSDGSND